MLMFLLASPLYLCLQAIDWGMGRSQRVLAFRNNEAFENAGSLSFMAPEVGTPLPLATSARIPVSRP